MEREPMDLGPREPVMHDERFVADTQALAVGGAIVSGHATRASGLHRQVEGFTSSYADAGGDGDFGKLFDEKYAPMAEAAREYLKVLDDTLMDLGVKTTKLSDVFDEVDHDSTRATSRPKRS